MEIIFITLGFRPYRFSGFDISGERLVDALVQRGHQVTVVSAVPDSRGITVEKATERNLIIYRLALTPLNWIAYSVLASRTVYGLVHKRSAVVHFWDIYFAYPFFGNFVATLHHSFRQRRLILKYQNIIGAQKVLKSFYYWFSQNLAEAPALRRARGLMAVSHSTQSEYIRHYCVPNSKVILTPHGIDTDHFMPVNNREIRHQYHIDQKEKVILFSGFFNPRKGIETLVQALGLIKKPYILALTGRWQDETYRARITALANKLGVKVIELGYVPEDQLPSIYSMADVYVSPSLVEGFGLPMAEALACELPVIATDVGASREVVGPGGYLVPPSNPEALARAIETILEAPELRREMGKNGRQHVVQNFNPQTMVEKTLHAYAYFLSIE